jgi:hypothetical protein
VVGRVSRIQLAVALALLAGATPAAASPNPVSVHTVVTAPDSVTVGERFKVEQVFSYPDTLVMSIPREIPAGTCRILSQHWSEKHSGGVMEKTLSLWALTLDLEQARLPALAVDFYTPSRDTVVALTDEVVIPVRRLAAAGAEVRPLKQQWEAPRRYWPWVLAAVLAAVLAGASWWWWRRRRRRRAAQAPAPPRLPADYVALAELTRIERMNLLARGEFKEYYTRVTDVLRRYLEARFGIAAMDRTTAELLEELESRGRRVEKLEDLLNEADLVKFAKYVPGEASGTAAMSSAREIVVRTTPRHGEASGGNEKTAPGPVAVGAATAGTAGSEERDE